DFVQVPRRMGFGSAFAQVRCDHRPEMVHPAPDGLIGDHDPAFRQQIFDVAEAQREPNIEPDRLLDDFGREAVAAVADLGHHRWLRLKVTDGKPNGDVTMPSRVSSFVSQTVPLSTARLAQLRTASAVPLTIAYVGAFIHFLAVSSLQPNS